MEKLLLVTNFGSRLMTVFVKEEQDEVVDRTRRQARGAFNTRSKNTMDSGGSFLDRVLTLEHVPASSFRPLWRQTRIHLRHDGEALDRMHGGEELTPRRGDHPASGL